MARKKKVNEENSQETAPVISETIQDSQPPQIVTPPIEKPAEVQPLAPTRPEENERQEGIKVAQSDAMMKQQAIDQALAGLGIPDITKAPDAKEESSIQEVPVPKEYSAADDPVLVATQKANSSALEAYEDFAKQYAYNGEALKEADEKNSRREYLNNLFQGAGEAGAALVNLVGTGSLKSTHSQINLGAGTEADKIRAERQRRAQEIKDINAKLDALKNDKAQYAAKGKVAEAQVEAAGKEKRDKERSAAIQYNNQIKLNSKEAQRKADKDAFDNFVKSAELAIKQRNAEGQAGVDASTVSKNNAQAEYYRSGGGRSGSGSNKELYNHEYTDASGKETSFRTSAERFNHSVTTLKGDLQRIIQNEYDEAKSKGEKASKKELLDALKKAGDDKAQDVWDIGKTYPEWVEKVRKMAVDDNASKPAASESKENEEEYENIIWENNGRTE